MKKYIYGVLPGSDEPKLEDQSPVDRQTHNFGNVICSEILCKGELKLGKSFDSG
jgi:hypothetical protein